MTHYSLRVVVEWIALLIGFPKTAGSSIGLQGGCYYSRTSSVSEGEICGII
jgi:hypothetical protein